MRPKFIWLVYYVIILNSRAIDRHVGNIKVEYHFQNLWYKECIEK